jgi:amidase
VPVERPNRDQLSRIADHYGFHLDEEALTSFGGLIDSSLRSYDAVDELYRAIAPEVPTDRPYQIVASEDNVLGAWYAKSDISRGIDGPLAGRRVVIKDNVAVAGLPMMNGSRSVEGYIPARDATVVTRLLDAGAIIAGKAVCEDLCFSGASHTSASGPVHNPWDPSRTSGGSSSGSAVLVATGQVDLAVGGDQGGSVRIPSAFSGTVGHKPTHGLVPYTGAFPIESTLDHLGPITRTVADAALMLAVMAGIDGHDPRQPASTVTQDYVAALGADPAGLRVGVVTEGFGILDVSEPGVDRAVRSAASRLSEAGIDVTEISIPWHRHGLDVWNVIATDGAAYQMLDGNGYGLNWEGLYDPELIAHYGVGRVRHADQLSETVKLVALCGGYSMTSMQARHYAMARDLVPVLRRAYDDALAEVDVLVMPTLPFTATPLVTPDDSRETYVASALGMLANTAPFNATGHPATSVPAGLVEGLPAGMMIVGRHFDDVTPLRVAHLFELLVGGFPQPPAAVTPDALAVS